MAPEMYEEGGYDYKVDVFSFGLVLYEMLTNEAVFGSNLSPHQIMHRAIKGKRPTVPDGLPRFVRDLIVSCWSADPSSRPSFSDIFDILRRYDYLITDEVDSSAVRIYVERTEPESS
jgi:serine/threonine protein kinase